MFTKWLSLLCLPVLLLGCNGGASGSGSTDTPSTDKPAVPTSTLKPVEGEFKVALITPGEVSDAGWSAMAYQALKGVEAVTGAKVSNEVAGGTKIKDSMRSYAQEGYHLVFGHGFEYNEPGVELAKDFPNTVFVSSSGGKTASNAGAFRFYLEQGFYLAGIMAAEMSKTGKIATVGLVGIPSIDSTFKAFEAGAKSVKPEIKVVNIGLQNGTDVAAAKQATLSAIGEGADFVIHQANNAAKGVFDACEEKGVYAFGANSDQNDNSSAVIASAIINAKPAFIDLAERVKTGKYVGGVELFGLDKGAIDFIVNPALAGKVSPEAMAAVENARAEIKAGKLVVPKDEF